MPLLFALFLTALQDRPQIVEVRPIMGDCVRAGCWRPLAVRVQGPAGFEGELVGSGDIGFQVVRPVRIPSGGAVDLLLPVVVLARDARIDVVLRSGGSEVDRKSLAAPMTFLTRERLVLVDPRHPEFDAWMKQELSLPTGARVVFVRSDPGLWNEAAEMGALEAADAVIASDETAVDLTMTAWRALGGALVTQPRRDLMARLEEAAARFPAVDPMIRRFSVTEDWIPRKRDATLLFVVIYGFGFFVAVYLTWSRRGGFRLVALSALGISALFVAGYAWFYPKGTMAFRSWQAVVDAPEAPVAVTVSALWGTGRTGDLEFGRIVKPVYPTAEAARRPIELRWTEGSRWTIRGVPIGDPVRFVTVDRLPPLDPHRPFGTFRPDETEYFQRIPRKSAIRPQDPRTSPQAPGRMEGGIETEPARVFRVEIRR